MGHDGLTGTPRCMFILQASQTGLWQGLDTSPRFLEIYLIFANAATSNVIRVTKWQIYAV
jgi:hypothetical protein